MVAPPPAQSHELWTFRWLCLLGGISLPLLGHIHVAASPGVFDPIWLRSILAVLPLGLFAGSFVSAAVRREMAGLTLVAIHLMVAWLCMLLVMNQLAAEYAVGALVMLVAVAAVSVGYRRMSVLGASIGLAGVALAAVAFVVDQPAVSPPVYASLIAVAAGALFFTAAMHMRVREELGASEMRYRTVFERVADGVLLVSYPGMQVLATNEAFRQMSGYSRQELSERPIYDLFDCRRDEVDRDVQRVLEEGYADIGERSQRTRDGAPIPVAIGLARIPDDEGSLICFTARDLSEEKRARSQVETARDQAQAMLELRTTFVNNMSHELRTPLVALKGFLGLLEEEDGMLDHEERRDIILSLRRSSDRLTQTLNALLDLAQIESGHLEIRAEPVEMNAAAREAVELLHDMAREKGLMLQFRPTESARVLVDRSALQRVLLNLFSNAIKFTPSGGITVTVEADSHRVFLHVRDTGVGIDPSFLPHLFGAFRQGSNGIAREHEGSGLGLTITKRLLELMGGRIRIDSAPGEGTCISVVFARTWAIGDRDVKRLAGVVASRADSRQQVPERADAPAELSIAPLAARPRVLIVEDNLDTARLMERMLKEFFDVETAFDARTALRVARAAWFDVLLVDIHLGDGMNGCEMLAKLRRMSAYAHVPAVAVTTYNSRSDRERFLSLGFDSYLPKPFTRKQLIAAAEMAHASRATAAS